jgi:hypothetical protein
MNSNITYFDLFSRRLFRCRPMIRRNVTPHTLHILVQNVEAEAATAQLGGHIGAADCLFWCAIPLREAAR